MHKQLPDTPWHIGSPKMKENDHRRLNKWCVHYDASFCTEPKSGCYMLRCGGSSHCKFYAEDEKASIKIKCDNRTQLEIDSEHRRQYVETLKPKMQALVSSLDGRRFISVQSINNCYICGSKLLKLPKNRKQCTLCHMEYVDQSSSLPDDTLIDGHFVYVMGQARPEIASDSQNVEPCQFCDDIGRCQEKNSPLFKKRCNPGYCKRLKRKVLREKQLEDYTFAGVKYIPMSKIIIRNKTPPSKSKIDHAVESILWDGGITKPIYVEVHRDKYLLKDGYIRYLAALECGLSSIPATLEREIAKKK